MAAAQKQHNCRVSHFGDKWWSITLYVDIDQLRMCYPREDGQSVINRWFHVIEWAVGFPRKLYVESGVQQSLARKYITERVRAVLVQRHGDWIYRYPFDFTELVFMFDSVVENPGNPVRFHDRVMA